MWLNVHGDEFVWDEFVGDKLFGDESSRIRKWNSELCFETKHRAHNSKTVHKQAENKRRTFIGQLVIN